MPSILSTHCFHTDLPAPGWALLIPHPVPVTKVTVMQRLKSWGSPVPLPLKSICPSGLKMLPPEPTPAVPSEGSAESVRPRNWSPRQALGHMRLQSRAMSVYHPDSRLSSLPSQGKWGWGGGLGAALAPGAHSLPRQCSGACVYSRPHKAPAACRVDRGQGLQFWTKSLKVHPG